MHGGSGEIGSIYMTWINRFVHLDLPFVTAIYTALRENVVVIGHPYYDDFMVSNLPQKLGAEPISPLHFREDVKAISPHPLLPDAETEMIIPLRSIEGIVGALCFYSCVQDNFNQQDISTFLPLADSIARIWSNLASHTST